MNELILLVLNAINTMLALAPTDTAGIAAAKRDVLDYLDRHDVDPSLVSSIHDTLNRVGAATAAADQAGVDTVAAIEPQALTPEERTAKTIDQAHNKGIPPQNTREYLKSIQTLPEPPVEDGAERKDEDGKKLTDEERAKRDEEKESLVDEKDDNGDHKKKKGHKVKLPPVEGDDGGLTDPLPQPQ